MLREWIFKLAEKLIEFLIKRKWRVVSPTNHRFFSEASRLRKYVIPYMKLEHNGKYDEGRTMIFRDMLDIKFRIWSEYILKVVSQKHCKKDDILNAIDKLVDDYNKERIVSDIPKIVASKFNEWHKEHAKILIQAIHDVCDSKNFNSEKEKLNAILYMHLNLLSITRVDAEKTLWSLNGEISGLVYKWFTLL